MNTFACSNCASMLASEDNFCRHCGTALSDDRLPAVRRPFSVTIWRPHVPPVVKGAAVMAAGTVGQYVVRRVLTNMITGTRKKPSRAIRRASDGMFDEAQIITETVMMRRVRIRRQA